MVPGVFPLHRSVSTLSYKQSTQLFSATSERRLKGIFFSVCLLFWSWRRKSVGVLLFGHSVMSDSLQPHARGCNCSTPGFPVLHYLLEFIQTHVHWVGDAIQPSHPLSPPSPPALNLSQHQGLFQWITNRLGYNLATKQQWRKSSVPKLRKIFISWFWDKRNNLGDKVWSLKSWYLEEMSISN